MTEGAQLKACCAAAYESEFARVLLGESLHPGGIALTGRLGELLALRPGQRVLDVAAGSGESAIFIAKRFGCEVCGVDFGADQVATASRRAADANMAGVVRVERGDAEQLPFAGGVFDAAVCECAFCTFPDKQAAAREFARVLKGGGRLGLSDLTRSGPLPPELEGLLAWIACIADARPASEYVGYLEEAGFTAVYVEAHDEALAQMVREIQGKLLTAELMVKLKKLELPGADFEQARQLARAAAEAVRSGLLGYSILTATAPLQVS
jgi:ubiquinone/menaquinone biosynthesis C-methylase UbiE